MGVEDYSSQVIASGFAVLYGVGIYYVLPLALITVDLQLIVLVFFAILIGIICGLTLLA
jgi:hypothetical protein